MVLLIYNVVDMFKWVLCAREQLAIGLITTRRQVVCFAHNKVQFSACQFVENRNFQALYGHIYKYEQTLQLKLIDFCYYNYFESETMSVATVINV